MTKKLFSLIICTASLFAFHITQTTAATRTFQETMTGYVTMKPYLIQDVVAKNSGIVQDEYLLNGEFVKENEPLFSISGETTNAKFIKLKSDVKIAKNRYGFLKAQYLRIRHLYAIHAAYKKELQEIKSRYQNSKAALSALQKQLAQYSRKTVYTADKNATVLDIAKQNGAFVKAGTTILTLSSCRKLYATAQFFDTHNKIKPSDTLIIKTPFKDKKAKVASVSMTAAGNGAREINFIFKQTKCQIMPNIVYQVTVIIKHFTVVAVPTECIIKKGDKFYLMAIESGKPKALHVNIAATQNGYTQITSGLKKGEKVVVKGAYFLFNKNIAKTLKIQD